MEEQLEAIRKVLERLLRSYKDVSREFDPTYDLDEDGVVQSAEEILTSEVVTTNRQKMRLALRIAKLYVKGGQEEKIANLVDEFKSL
jgi:hypothetical protein